MNWDRLRLVTAPAVAPLAWEAAKAHLRLSDDELDTAEERAERQAEVEALIVEAVGEIDGPRGIGIAMIEQTWRLTLDAFTARIVLPLGPVSAILSVKYIDTAGDLQTVDPGDYQLADGIDPAVLTPTYSTAWPTARCEPGAVRIEFKAGFGPDPEDVPQDLVAALKLILSSRHDGDGELPKAATNILNRYAVIAPA